MTAGPARGAAVVVDAAGGDVGGAARWREELDAYLTDRPHQVSVIGRTARVTLPWLARREQLARGAAVAVAPNNVSFTMSGHERRVLARNALHFVHPDELPQLWRMPRSFLAQVPIVRRALRRADVVVAPCSAMAERIAHHVPAVAGRIVVRHHPVTPVGGREPAAEPFVLVPVRPSPYRDLAGQLRALLAAQDRVGAEAGLRVTADAADLPPDVAGHPRVEAIGVVPHRRMAVLWRRAAAAFFPSSLESFGYPLAEARAYGLRIVAPDNAQAREIAGPALAAYRPGDAASLADAVARAAEPVPAEPEAFDRDRYFAWLFDAVAGRTSSQRVD